MKKLIGIDYVLSTDSELIPTNINSMPALNTILYGPPGTGKTYTLRNEYMKLFTENQMVTQEQFVQELAGELTWLYIITIALYDLKSAKVPSIFEHPLLKPKLASKQIENKEHNLAHLQQHTKMDYPNVKHTTG